MRARYFRSPGEFRAWLEAHHEDASELLVGFHKTGTGRRSMTWPQSVDEALCFGWIDGVRRRVDDERYTIRFTPRKPSSTWSAVNVAKVQELTAGGRMRPAGLRAFERRRAERTAIYSYEREQPATFDPDQERRFRAAPGAWAYFEGQAPSYRRAATNWVVSAKRAETRERRLTQLIDASAAGRPVAHLDRSRY